MQRLILTLSALALTSLAQASVPQADTFESIKMALRLPLENRVTALQGQGPETEKKLVDLAFNKKESVQYRWRSMTALGRLYPVSSRKHLEKAFSSKEWFMRNSALVASARGERSWALKWATHLLNDPALVVRTAAVQTIYKIRGIESGSQLWDKLYAKENYKKGQSLWVRKYIAQTLAVFAEKGQESRFVRILQDPDKSLHPHGVAGLEKITGSSFAKKSADVATQRKKWLDWWFKNRVL